MTITISTISKTKKAGYWLATGFTATAYFVICAADILHAPMMMASLARLGYPVYLATILGVWKLLGAAAITAPGLPRLKEWAYAGMFFNLTGAALSHAASGDPPKKYPRAARPACGCPDLDGAAF
jgi:hypothetical protein